MDATQQDLDLLERLPAEDVGPTVLHHAGLHTRLVCRKYRDLHPQLTALAPQGLRTDEGLTAALASLPSSLTSLDLRRVGDASITPACLAAVAAAAPRLEALRLGRVPDSLLPAVLNTMSSCTNLHTVSLSTQQPFNAAANAPTQWVRGLAQPPMAGNLRSLDLPNFLHALCEAPASAFPHLTALYCAHQYAISSPVAGEILVTLAAAAPALQHLQLYWEEEVQRTRHLSALTGLTTLQLTFDSGGQFVGEDDMEGALAAGEPSLDCAPVLQGIACLTNLRSLQLGNFCSSCTPAAAGWHSCLTRLTHLHLDNFLFKPDPAADVAAATSEAVAAAAQQLPALRSLALRDCSRYLQHPNFLPYLAAATQLQRLSLDLMEMCPAQVQALSSLQALTSLELIDYDEPEQPGEALPSGVSLQWVSALTNLRQLSFDEATDLHTRKDLGALLRGQVLEPLLHLHTLKLCVFVEADVPHSTLVAELLAAVQGRLEHLQLGLWHIGAKRFVTACPPSDSSLLAQLAFLRVLHVRDWTIATAAHKLLRLPPSLRWCYLPRNVNDARLQQLQVAHPGVAFRR